MASPIVKYRSGNVQGAIFSNKKKSEAGKDYDAFSANISKSFKDGEEYKETTTFFENDLSDLIVVATECQRYIKLEARKKQ